MAAPLGRRRSSSRSGRSSRGGRSSWETNTGTCTWLFPMEIPAEKSASICFRAPTAAGTGVRPTSISLNDRKRGGIRGRPSWPPDRVSGPALSGSTQRWDGERPSSVDLQEITVGPRPSVSTTMLSTRCMAPGLAVRGDSIYVAWKVVKGDWTTLYFDHSQDGGATWNTDQVVFKRRALPVRASLHPVGRRTRGRLGRIASPDSLSAALLSFLLAREGLDDSGRVKETPWRETMDPAGSITASTCCPGKGDAWWPIPRAQSELLPEIYLAWSGDLESGFSELMKISAPKKGFQHLYPRLVRSGENEIAVVYNRRKIRRLLMEPRVILGDVLVARIGIP